MEWNGEVVWQKKNKNKMQKQSPRRTDTLPSFHEHLMVSSLLYFSLFLFCLSLFFTFFLFWGLGGSSLQIKTEIMSWVLFSCWWASLQGCLWQVCGGSRSQHIHWFPVDRWPLFSRVCPRKHISSTINAGLWVSRNLPRVLAFITLLFCLSNIEIKPSCFFC